MSASPERRRRYALGHWAEALSAWHLRLRFYRVIAQRYKCPVGEIDLIVRRGRTVAFVEVKARMDFATAMESISIRQRRRIWRAAESFIAGRPRLAGCDFRFDVMVVAPWRVPRHIEDAWRNEGFPSN